MQSVVEIVTRLVCEFDVKATPYDAAKQKFDEHQANMARNRHHGEDHHSENEASVDGETSSGEASATGSIDDSTDDEQVVPILFFSFFVCISLWTAQGAELQLPADVEAAERRVHAEQRRQDAGRD